MSRASDRAQFAGDTCDDRMGSGVYDAEEFDMAELNAQAAEWRQRWPAHCKACGGWGGTAYTEMHGFKGGSGETIADPCDALPETTCHRCGAADGLTAEGEGPCRHCGWNYDDGDPTP